METVEDYLSSFDESQQAILRKIRALILDSHPEIVESMAYGLPAYKLNKKPLIYFGGFKQHIGIYATPKGNQAFERQLSKYKHGKGSIQFPLKEEIPYSFIKEIVEFRITELTKSKM